MDPGRLRFRTRSASVDCNTSASVRVGTDVAEAVHHSAAGGSWPRTFSGLILPETDPVSAAFDTFARRQHRAPYSSALLGFNKQQNGTRHRKRGLTGQRKFYFTGRHENKLLREMSVFIANLDSRSFTHLRGGIGKITQL